MYGVSIVREDDFLMYEGDADNVSDIPFSAAGEFGSSNAGAAQKLSYAERELQKYPIIRSILQAYKTLQESPEPKRIEIGVIDDLVNLKWGYLKGVFPTIFGEKLGTRQSQMRVGLKLNAASALLALERTEDGQITYIFTSVMRDGRSTESKFVFDQETKSYRPLKSLSAETIREAQRQSKNLQPGEEIDVGPIDDFVHHKSGSLHGTFPTPNEKTLYTSKSNLTMYSFGGGYNVKTVSLRMGKDEPGEIYHAFVYIDKNGKSNISINYWDEEEERFITKQARQAKNIKNAYAKINLSKKRQRIFVGDVRELQIESNGRLASDFPLFTGETLGHLARILPGFGHAKKKVLNLILETRDDKGIYYIFDYAAEGNEKGVAEIFWDFERKQFIRDQNLALETLSQAYEKLRTTEGDLTVEIGDIYSLYVLASGLLKGSFLLSNGEIVGQERKIYVGSGRDVQSIRLTLQKKNGEIQYIFDYIDNKGFLGRSILVWDGQNQTLVNKEQISFERKPYDRENFIAHFRLAEKLLSDTRSHTISVELGEVSEFIEDNHLPGDFPIPGGQVLGQRQFIELEGEPVHVHFTLEKRRDRRLYYVFSYMDREGQLRKTEFYWDPIEDHLVELSYINTEAQTLLKDIEENEWRLGDIQEKSGMTDLYTFAKEAELLFPVKNHLIQLLNTNSWEPQATAEALKLPTKGFQGVLNQFGLGPRQRNFYRTVAQEMQRARKILLKSEEEQTIDIGDISDLFFLGNGQLKQGFPSPDNSFDPMMGIGLSNNLGSVNLKMQKRSDGQIYYIFTAFRTKGRHPVSSELIWDEKEEKYRIVGEALDRRKNRDYKFKKFV